MCSHYFLDHPRISAFDSKSNFLKGLGLAVTVCGTKGFLPHAKRRLAPAMSYFAVNCIVLRFYCHFIIERYEDYIKRTNIPI